MTRNLQSVEMKNRISIAILAGSLCFSAYANERYFTYTYEPETMPEGGMEFEQWVTLRAGRNAAVGQENYSRWDLREELEYGVTDNYTVSLYLKTKSERYTEPDGNKFSDFSFDGVSLENRYMVLNPADHAVGLSLYLEPSYSGDEAELEEKIILGQRHGNWKWALNLTHATEWADDFNETEGELEATFGVAYQLTKRCAVGIEVRDHNELPEYDRWENTALYVGPVVSYKTEKWWAALSVMPQVFGANWGGDPDKNSHFELEGHEHVNVRLIVGLSF